MTIVLINSVSVIIVSIFSVSVPRLISIYAVCVSTSDASNVSSFSVGGVSRWSVFLYRYKWWDSSLFVSMLSLGLLVSTSSRLILSSVWLSVIVLIVSACVCGVSSILFLICKIVASGRCAEWALFLNSEFSLGHVSLSFGTCACFSCV